MDIYFIQAGRAGPIKIGKSANPLGRMSDLQTSNPNKLMLLASYKEFSGFSESKLHQVFAENRIRGEWFEPTRMLLKLIAIIRRNSNHNTLLEHLGLATRWNRLDAFGVSMLKIHSNFLSMCWHNTGIDPERLAEDLVGQAAFAFNSAFPDGPIQLGPDHELVLSEVDLGE